ncbi:MAG: energy transducer TonB [Vicinamibacteria bacterium]
MATRRTLAVLVLAAAAARAALAADAPKPHGLGLLASRVTDEAAVERLRAGLTDADARTRAAATRVVNVSGTGALVPAVREALAKETDEAAASEMIRFLTALARPELDAEALAAARRLGAGVHLALADGLGRRGAAAHSQLASLREIGLSDPALATFYRLATAGGVRGPLAAPVLREGAVGPWAALLASARETRQPVEEGLLVVALRSESAAMRTATCWHVALERRDGPAPTLDEAFPVAAPEEPTGQDPELRRACEYARRARGRSPRAGLTEGPATPTALSALEPDDRRLYARLYELATLPERKALRAAAPSPGFVDALVARSPSGTVQARTVGELPDGYAADLLAAADCRLGETHDVRGGRVTFAPDGRPRSVPAFPGAKKCEEAARALIASSLAPLGVPVRADEPWLLLVPDRSNVLMPARPRTPRVPLKVGSSRSLREPKKVTHVNPTFPPSARGGKGGVVVLTTVIGTDGRIGQIQLLESAGQELDLSAIGAVGGWRYTPVLLDGEPVPVVMTVTVNYKVSGSRPSSMDPSTGR